MKYLFFLSAFLINMAQAQMAPMFKPIFSIDGSDELRTMDAASRVEWKFKYINSMMGMPHRMFMPMHEKLMHLVIISEDLQNFAHVHPKFTKAKGEFSLEMNSVSDDFDNQDLADAIPYNGKYYVIAEVMPMVHGQEVPMIFSRFEVNAVNGKDREPVVEDYPDAIDGIEKFFNDEGKVSTVGAKYKIRFSYNIYDFCDYWLPKFYYEFFHKDETGNYVPVEKFERWLGMGGHSILIGSDDMAWKDKTFYHLHAFLPMAKKGKFSFPYHDHTKPLPRGKYKIFGQFRIGDVIFTTPFTFKYDFPDVNWRKCR